MNEKQIKQIKQIKKVKKVKKVKKQLKFFNCLGIGRRKWRKVIPYGRIWW
jgi:hypothetical protein